MLLPPLPLSTPALLLDGIAAAAALVYLPFVVVASSRLQIENAMATPRALVDKLPAYAQRATWAHENAFESFVLFAAAALMAYVTGQQSALAGWAAIAYVTARLFYPVFYILNVTVGRSLMFAIGSLSIATLMGLSLLTIK